MRNGNIQIFDLFFQIFEFLPYLWGMETESIRPRWVIDKNGSYRTYEEWKPDMIPDADVYLSGFLPYLWGMETHKNLGSFPEPA